jgi:ABC-type uncharacterized transport system permease subunit
MKWLSLHTSTSHNIILKPINKQCECSAESFNLMQMVHIVTAAFKAVKIIRFTLQDYSLIYCALCSLLF